MPVQEESGQEKIKTTLYWDRSLLKSEGNLKVEALCKELEITFKQSDLGQKRPRVKSNENTIFAISDICDESIFNSKQTERLNFVIVGKCQDSFNFNGNVVVLSDLTATNLQDAVKYFIEYRKERDRYLLTEKICKNTVLISKVATQFLRNSLVGDGGHSSSRVLEINRELLVLKQSIYRADSYVDFIKILDEHARNITLFERIDFCDFATYMKSENLSDDKEISLPLFMPDESMKYSLVFHLSEIASKNQEEAFYWMDEIQKMFTERIYEQIENEEIKEKSAFLEEAFAILPYPMAMISSKGEILLHNLEYGKLKILPGECLTFKNNDKLEKKKSVFEIYRSELLLQNEKYSFFLFRQAPEMAASGLVSSSELGIISSSIAHELNNPIAGIIAALSLLSLEDHFQEQYSLEFSEMKKSAERCRQLIEVFLGFSKVRPEARKMRPLKDALLQAVEMLKFRMMESNLRIDVSIENEDARLGREVNPSVATMFFYLIFSDIMTAFAHHKLISEEDENRYKIIDCLYLETEESVEIIVRNDFNFLETVKKSKLMRQLIEFENLELQLTSDRIILRI